MHSDIKLNNNCDHEPLHSKMKQTDFSEVIEISKIFIIDLF